MVSGLGSLRNLQGCRAVNGGDFNLAAQGSPNHGKRILKINGPAVPLEKIMGIHVDDDIEVPGPTTPAPALSFAGKTHSGTAVNTGRNFQIDLLRSINQAGAIAIHTRFTDNLSTAMALRAGGTDLEKSL